MADNIEKWGCVFITFHGIPNDLGDPNSYEHKIDVQILDHDLANVDEDEEKDSKCKQQALKRLPVLNLLSLVFISVVGLDLQLAGNDATQKRYVNHL